MEDPTLIRASKLKDQSIVRDDTIKMKDQVSHHPFQDHTEEHKVEGITTAGMPFISSYYFAQVAMAQTSFFSAIIIG